MKKADLGILRSPSEATTALVQKSVSSQSRIINLIGWEDDDVSSITDAARDIAFFFVVASGRDPLAELTIEKAAARKNIS
jgi:hypothetical protein